VLHRETCNAELGEPLIYASSCGILAAITTSEKANTMRTLAAAALLFSLSTTASATTSEPDLASADGFAATCGALPREPSQLATIQQRQAFAICRDVTLVQDIATFARTAEKTFGGAKKMSDAEVKQLLRTKLTYVRDELRTVRLVLEKLKLGKNDGVLIAPANWQLDLDGDAKIETWERYFFAIPKRGKRPFRVSMPNNTPSYYQDEYQLDASVRVDQSDILWSLSYHYFAEALLETILSYTLNSQDFKAHAIELVDPAGMKRANRLMVRGFQTSEAMRRTVLAEKDDDHEWIANPNQVNTVFPLPLDAEDFKVWGTALGFVIPLFEGKTLLQFDSNAGGLLGSASRICPNGKGLNVTHFYNQPPRYPLEQLNMEYLSSMCQQIDKAHPASGLFAFLQEYGRRAESQQGAGMMFLRHLLWVN
jgi:hypothetical protein